MSTPDFKRALARMETVIANWFISDYMMLSSWTMLEKRPSPHVTTLGLDTRTTPAILNYNPNFINAINDETLEMVMADQGLKILLRHATTRMKNPRDVAALSSSITVDQIILKDQAIGEFKDIFLMPEQYGLERDKFYENYYRTLSEDLDGTRSKMEKQFGKSASEKEKEELEQELKKKQKEEKKEKKDSKEKDSEESGEGEEQDGEGEGQESEDGKPSKDKKGKKGKSGNGETSEDGEPNPGEGQESESVDGEGEEGGSSSGNGSGESKEPDYKEFKNPHDAMKEHMDPRNDNNKNWGENEGLDAEVQNMVDEHKGSSQKWGKYAGNALAAIVAANTPKINYKEVIRRFNQSVTTSKQIATRMKPNRRFGLDAPGRRRVYTTKILFALDVSGSMSDEDIAEGFAVVNACCRHAEVHWMTFDTEIHDIATKIKKAQQMFKVTGRGGTDPSPVLAYADEHKYDGVIIYSDLDFYGGVKAPRKAKVMWLGTCKTAKNPTNFGYYAALDRLNSW